MNTNRYNIRTSAIHLAAALMFLPFIQPVQAEDDEITMLRNQVQELQRTVQILQERVERLEGKHQTGAIPPTRTGAFDSHTSGIHRAVSSEDTPVAAKQYPTKEQVSAPQPIKQNWHALEKGMNARQVTVLLGAPTRTFKLNNNLVWYYDYERIGAGSVMFSKKGEVIGWQAPPKRWLW